MNSLHSVQYYVEYLIKKNDGLTFSAIVDGIFWYVLNYVKYLPETYHFLKSYTPRWESA